MYAFIIWVDYRLSLLSSALIKSISAIIFNYLKIHIYPPISSFDGLTLNENILRGIYAYGFENP